MKTVLILSLVVFTTFCSSEVRKTPDSQKQPSETNKISDSQMQAWSCQTVTNALSEIKKIKVGMKRKDLEKIFSQSGGLSSIILQRFDYKQCKFIKVDVKFAVADKNQRVPKFDPDDEITEISKSYLEYPVYD